MLKFCSILNTSFAYQSQFTKRTYIEIKIFFAKPKFVIFIHKNIKRQVALVNLVVVGMFCLINV